MQSRHHVCKIRAASSYSCGYGQPRSTAYWKQSRCFLVKASIVVRASQRQPCSCAVMRHFKCPFVAAISQVRSFVGQRLSKRYCSTSECPPADAFSHADVSHRHLDTSLRYFTMLRCPLPAARAKICGSLHFDPQLIAKTRSFRFPWMAASCTPSLKNRFLAIAHSAQSTIRIPPKLIVKYEKQYAKTRMFEETPKECNVGSKREAIKTLIKKLKTNIESQKWSLTPIVLPSIKNTPRNPSTCFDISLENSYRARDVIIGCPSLVAIC